jgi:uncharacterized protein
MDPLPAAGLALIGLVVGALGTLIGAGGGFLLLPILAFLYPRESPDTLTALSLAVVCANAISGSAAYARLRRIDFRSGAIFALAGLPGALLGAWVTRFLDRRTFDPLLGGFLLVSGGWLLVRPRHDHAAPAHPTRTLVERDGTIHAYSPRVVRGALLSLGVGFVSSLLGLGGGIIHVPLMVVFLGFPVHVATATSHFVLAILALAGVLVHAASGSLAPAWPRVLPLALGVIAGAQGGARLSGRVRDQAILRALGLGLALVGLRLLWVRG